MGKFLGIAILVAMAVIVFGYVGSGLSASNPLQPVADGIRGIVEGILDSIAAVGRGVAGVFGD